MKNKSTEQGREFWTHVEAVAERVRKSPELYNHKTIAPLNKPDPHEETVHEAEHNDEQ